MTNRKKMHSILTAAVLLLAGTGRHHVQSWLAPVSSLSLSKRQQHRPRLMMMYTDDNEGFSKEQQEEEGENADAEPVFFDDFGGQLIGGGSSSGSSSSSSSSASSSASVLQERIQTAQQQQIRQDAQRWKNWNSGNWNVRGFSLDPENAADDTAAVVVSIGLIVPGCSSSYHDDDDDETEQPPTLWVARSDGTVVCVKLGTAYWTHFKSTLAATPSADNPDAVQVSSQLVRDKEHFMSGGRSSSEEEGEEDQSPQPPENEEEEVPFEILHQFSTVTTSSASSTNPQISSLLAANQYVFTSNEQAGDIIQWQVVSGGGDATATTTTTTRRRVVQKTAVWTGAHDGSTVRCLKALSLKNHDNDNDDDMDDEEDEEPPANVLFSAAENGSLALWDLRTGDLLYRGGILLSEPQQQQGSMATLTSADSNGRHIYVATSTGQVLAYVISDLLVEAGSTDAADATTTDTPIPAGRWTASSAPDVPLTVVTCAGAGSLGRGRGPAAATDLLLTGDAAGVLKQWEVLARPAPPDDKDSTATPTTRLEQWPKLATQRLPKKAHVFDKGHSWSGAAVTALKAMDAHKIVSAGADGTVRAWNPATGRELFAMDGFSQPVTSLCLLPSLQSSSSLLQSSSAALGMLLVTNGLEKFVCVHDFDAVDPLEDNDNDYLEEL